MKKIYTRLTKITKATVTLEAEDVGNEEMALVDGRQAQVVKIAGNEITLQVFSGTDGLATNSRVQFMGHAPQLMVGNDLSGRYLNAFGDPIDGGPALGGEVVELGGPTVNPVRREQPFQMIATGIAGIDLNNSLVAGQKIPFFADPVSPITR